MSHIFQRQSIRKFTSEVVSDEQLREIVYAGLAAPSSKNKQPWQMCVITDRDLLDKMVPAHPNWRLLTNVQQAIVVCGDLSLDDREPQVVLNAAAATQNMLLRASELGLGSVWLGSYPDRERMELFQRLFKTPESVFPVAVIALGHYDHEAFPPKERVVDESKIHWNMW